MVKRHRNKGEDSITEVEIKGKKKFVQRDVVLELEFSMKGSSEESIIGSFANLKQSLEEAKQKLDKQDEHILVGEAWDVTMRKK